MAALSFSVSTSTRRSGIAALQFPAVYVIFFNSLAGVNSSNLLYTFDTFLSRLITFLHLNLWRLSELHQCVAGT